MSFVVPFCFLATLLAVWPLTRQDLPVVAGAVRASGAGELITVKIGGILLLLGGIAASVLRGGPVNGFLLPVLPEMDFADLFAIGLSTLAAVLLSSRINPATGAPYAFLGALFGCTLVTEGTADWGLAGRYILSWIAAPLCCGLLAAGFTLLGTRLAGRRGVHLAVSDHRGLLLSLLTSLLLAFAAGWNTGLIAGLFPAGTLGFGAAAAGIALGTVLLSLVFSSRPVTEKLWQVADDELDLHSTPVLAVLLAMACSYALFSSRLVAFAGLAPTPLSAPALLTAALVGTGLARRNATVEAGTILRSFAATAASPVLGLLAGYCLGAILNYPLPKARGPQDPLISILVVLGTAAAAILLTLYIRGQRRRSLENRLLRSREQQIYNAQKSLSALEVRAEMNEKDLLAKLENKRKELVDFAVGISEQKSYMEQVYDGLEQVRQLSDPAEKDRATDELLSSLRERMYFTREMNDFYAQSEILHKDFNLRLREAYPKLTESERKLANLLRQGFSSKYIASLMNITPKSVEISRYRLRIKLGLRRSDNLVAYIKSL